MNFSYNNSNNKTLCVDIIIDVMDELRRERKIAMVLADAEIEQYIKLDFSNLDPNAEGLDPFHKKSIEEKVFFRENLCQRISILRLGYMFRVLNAVHPGKASMLSAEAFKVKVIKMENKQDKRKKFASKKKDANASSIGGTMDSQVIREERALNLVDPLLLNINSFINEITDSVAKTGAEKKKEIETIYKDHGATTTAGDTKGGYDTHNQLDTIEENLAAIERKNSADNDWM